MTTDLHDLAWAAVATPSREAAAALEVLADALIEQGIVPGGERAEMLGAAWAWAYRATLLPLSRAEAVGRPTTELVNEAVERALRGERVLILVASHRDATRVDALARARFLERIRTELLREDAITVWERIHVETPNAEARIRGFAFSTVLDDTAGSTRSR